MIRIFKCNIEIRNSTSREKDENCSTFSDFECFIITISLMPRFHNNVIIHIFSPLEAIQFCFFFRMKRDSYKNLLIAVRSRNNVIVNNYVEPRSIAWVIYCFRLRGKPSPPLVLLECITVKWFGGLGHQASTTASTINLVRQSIGQSMNRPINPSIYLEPEQAYIHARMYARAHSGAYRSVVGSDARDRARSAPAM